MTHAMEFGEYMPHGMCLLWQPWLVLLWAGSDALIFLSYTAIPIALLLVLRQRKDVPHSGLVALFASFILLCGLTHLMGIVTLWWPIYPFVGALKLATGLVSLATAVVLFRLIPTLVRLPSPAAMEFANRQLREEIAAHKETLASLESQVEARTAELKQANAMLAVQAREAVHRSSNLLAVVSSLANQTAKGAERTDEFLSAFLARVAALSDATRSVTESKNRSSTGIEQVVETRLAALKDAWSDRVSIEGPSIEISPEAAQQLSLALHELATNTQKYGLGVNEDARVHVSWRLHGERFELIWRETGLADAATNGDAAPEGFGTQLLTRVVPAVLKGSASKAVEDGDLVYRLEADADLVTAREEGEESARMAARIVDDSFGLEPR
ncbi:MAG: sensor histidine kinase [Oceanicaulis sp.]